MAKLIIRSLSKSHSELLKSVRNYNDHSKWETTHQRFVAFFDILGFKEMILRDSHEDIYNKLVQISDLKKEVNPAILDKNFDYESVKPIEIIAFSDSIIIFSKNDSVESFKVFVESINRIFAKIIEFGVPVKGSLAHGSLSLNIEKQIFFGQPLIDAYQLQEDVDYFGVVAHHSIDRYIFENNISEINDLIFEILTPLKSGRIMHLNLNYFPFIIYNDYEKMHDYLKTFKLSASGRPRKYLENTINFYKEYSNFL